MSEATDATEVQTGTRVAAVLLIEATALAVADLDNDTTTEAEATAGLVAIDHAAKVASVHALLAIESRLGELVDHLGEVARLLRPRTADLGPAGILHNPHGLSVEDVTAAYERANPLRQSPAHRPDAHRRPVDP